MPLTVPKLRLVVRDRRRTPRVHGPFSATWEGATGPAYRVPDISAHGCYVNSLSAPPAGSPITLSLTSEGARRLSVRGEVQSVDPGIGFSVQFMELPAEDLEILARWMAGHAASEDGVPTR